MASLFLPDSGVLPFAVGRRRRGFRMAYYAAGTGVDGSGRWRGNPGAAIVTMASRFHSARSSRAPISSRQCFAEARAGAGGEHPTPEPNHLPARLRELIEQSVKLQERVIRLDQMLGHETGSSGGELDHPLQTQLSRLRAAFGKEAEEAFSPGRLTPWESL